MNPIQNRRKPWIFDGFALCAAAVVVAALVARVWGNGFGLPFLYHEDEGGIVPFALRMPAAGPDPHWFHYPTLAIYAHAILYAAVYAVERMAGAVASYADFAARADLDPTVVYRAGRTLTAVAGAGAVAGVALAARRLGSLEARDRGVCALVAALLLACDAIHLEHSHYITADVPLSLAAIGVLLAVAPLAAAPDGGSLRGYALAGAVVGLGASIKYPGAVLAVAIVAVYALRVDWREWRARVSDPRLPVAGAASIAAFLAGSPYVVLNWREFVRDFSEEAAHMRAGHLGFEGGENHWLTLLDGVASAGGVGILVLFAVGAVVVVRRRDTLGVAALVTALALFAAAASSNVLFTRYVMPVLPLAAVVAARGAVALGRGRRAAIAALVAAAVALPVYVDANRLRLLTAGDTRTLARAWVETEARAPVAVEWKSVPIGPAPIASVETSRLVYDLDALRARGVRYVVVTDRLYKRLLKAPDLHAKQVEFYRELLATGTKVAAFSPFDGDAGRLTAGPDGEPRIERGAGGPEWASLGRRRLLGPVIEVFDLGAPE